LNSVLGVYYDEEKIFLARIADKLETAEINFEIDSSRNAPAVEQLAEKIKFICNKNGWKNSRVGVVLRDGAAVTLQTDFKNVPADEIPKAVEIWAVAHAKSNARYTSIQRGNEIWMEALPASIVEEYISAFEKNSMILCALTEIPSVLNDERPLTPFNRAVFAADIVKNNKSPNILSTKISTWNIKKISLTAAAIFLIVLTGFSAKLANDYFSAAKRAETAHTRFNSQNDAFYLKQNFDASTARLKQLYGLICTQDINLQKFNALIKIGGLSDGKIILNKIKTSGETLELEGTAESPEIVKHYLNRLKNSILPKVKLKSSSEIDGQFIFSISVTFSYK
jgi:hypothetical protein